MIRLTVIVSRNESSYHSTLGARYVLSKVGRLTSPDRPTIWTSQSNKR